MTKEDKIKLAIEKGYTCNPETGEVFGIKNKKRVGKCENNGYVRIAIYDNNRQYMFGAHQFIWYWVHKEVVECIDHINRVRDDNRISNLRSVTQRQNHYNVGCKGYYYVVDRDRWRAQIKTNGISLYLGSFNTEQEAKQAYLDAKQKYHQI
jgi:hypothetical protein